MNGNDAFSINKAYKVLLGELPKAKWEAIIFHNQASPKDLFIVWLVM